MDAFTTHTGRAVPLRRSNVDTDQIIPAVWLKQVSRTGFEKGLFAAWREDPSFVLNNPVYEGASILVTGPDFGTGSSREHAVWALQQYGFRAVIAARFGDIFRNNSTKMGLLPIVLPPETVEALQAAIEADPATEVTVDLRERQVRWGGERAGFDPRLLQRLDAGGRQHHHQPERQQQRAAPEH
ncbi:3-isopropylmalate dehydratase small subunit, partial [Sphaerisporangium sp. NPDC049002]|uniref:3-isopropylmalate dehydratase small subunit n=1 Tax=Sphaerisporangium sp. NPDC049002 TaxID=3155392 RepID=UPI0033E78CEB